MAFNAAFKRTPAAIAAALATLLAAAQAQEVPAQDAATQPETRAQTQKQTAEPERVVITATRRAVPASKVPYNVTAIGEEALREGNITDAKKLISQSVSISAPGNSARFADSVTVRGLNVSEVGANNIEQFVRTTLAYYIDDTPLPNLGYRIKDIARVETLLGPQGTLYGAGSLGGAVRYITNKPRLGQTEAKLNTSFWQVKYGGLSNDTDAIFNLPIGSSVALRAAIARLDEKGYTDRVSNPPWRTGADAWETKPDANRNVYENDDWQKVTGGRFSALWKPMSGVEITFAHTTQDQLANGTTGVSLLPLGVANATDAAGRDDAWKNPGRRLANFLCQPNCAYTDAGKAPLAVNDHSILSRYPEFADRKFRMNSVDLDIDLGFANLHSSTSQFKDSRIGQADYANQGYVFYYTLGDLGGAIDSGRSAYMTFNNTYKGLSHETRLVSKGDGPVDWIAGLYYTRQDRSFKFSEVLPGMDAYLGGDKAVASPLPDVGYSEDLSSKYKETALFGEVGYRITEPWRVSVGARVFNYRDTSKASIVDYAGGFADSDFTASASGNSQSYYKLNTSYQLAPELLGYVTFSQGFRRGGTNAFKDLPGKTVAPDSRQYKPDSTNNYEVGLKGYLLDDRLYLATDVYRIDWKDTQTYFSQDLGGFPINGTTNGPKSRSQGWEFDARYKVTDNWQATFSTATTSSEWVETKTKCIYTDGTDCRPTPWTKGGKLGGSAKWKHALGVRYQTALANDMFLTANLKGRYTGKVLSDRADDPRDNSTTPTYPSYTTYDASVGLSKDDWDLSLWVENLGDAHAQTSRQAAGLMGPRLIYTQPRSIGMNLSYKFK